ncbi:MAG TPA: glucose 1-dehydrogenase [Blastocatellia bacterium]|nr:glucose 1-dehydrogenase [Blastocatellia bacterium]
MNTERKRPLDEEFQMPSMRLDGRAALVTGGSRGLGLAMALTLAHAGADVAIIARTPDELEKAADLIRQRGVKALPLQADISDTAKLRELVNHAAGQFGRLDILVNSAGINLRQPFDTFTEADWDRLMAINLKGAFFASQEAVKFMRQQGKGKIINVGSIAAKVVVPNISPYAISKGGIGQMTAALAVDLARDNICVNAIGPGRFWTQMTDGIFSNPQLYESAVSVIPLGRPGLPSELAGVTLLLASDAGDYITGQTIYVDGGWLVSVPVKA